MANSANNFGMYNIPFWSQAIVGLKYNVYILYCSLIDYSQNVSLL